MAVRAEPIDRLRDDVRLLGELVGGVLREQGGAKLFDAVEHLRIAAIELRSTRSAGSDEELIEWVQKQSTLRLLQLVRAFSVYFHLINLAEQQHRVRTLRVRQRTSNKPLHESIAAARADLHVSDRDLEEGLGRLRVHPVLTAHPSEARRRSLLRHLEGAARAIEQLDDERLTPNERAAILDALRVRTTLIWQTAEARTERPSVLDEVQSVLYFLAGTVYDVLPLVYRAIHRAGLPANGRLLRFGSWVGGDRDGNPNVTPDVTRAAARLARAAVLRRYREDVRALGRDLSISGRLTGCQRELLESLDRDREELAVQAVPQWRDEPYRRKLGLIGERLRRTDSGGPGGYATAEQMLADLDLMGTSLLAHGGDRIARGPLADLRQRVETFGFYLAELEIRQHAQRHASAAAELLALAGVPGFLNMNEQQRQQALERCLEGEGPLGFPAEALSPETREVIDTFHAVADVQRMCFRT
jgi:phosphoenolpyruvate carboxylase